MTGLCERAMTVFLTKLFPDIAGIPVILTRDHNRDIMN